MIVIGTAGHIDHGKSSIVRRLTGTDPDRLPEEKERGMTIDLGFAFYHTTKNETIGIVDVPGHERFVRTMIAGAGGLDFVFLVVAADDGWMPQTEEHAQIIRLLGITHGAILLNKSDLATDEWLALLENEIRERTRSLFPAPPPIFRISTETGEGFAQLESFLDDLPGSLNARRDKQKGRLPIDRVFLSRGIGAIVTGTLRDGTLSVGQSVTVWPSGERARIRSLQSGNEPTEIALPGQRTAISLTGIETDHLLRGGVVSSLPSLIYLQTHPVLALTIELLPDSPIELKPHRRLNLLTGTAEVEGEIRLHGSAAIRPGGKGVVYFKPTVSIFSLVGDAAILRLPTPMRTLGGGRVLDHLTRFPRQTELARFDYLTRRNPALIDTVILTELEKHPSVEREELLAWAAFSPDEIASHVKPLLAKGDCVLISNALVSPRHAERLEILLKPEIERYLSAYPHHHGVPADHIATSLLSEVVRLTPLLEYLVGTKKLEKRDDLFTLPGPGVSLTGPTRTAYDEIRTLVRREPYTPPSLATLAEKGKPYREAIAVLIKEGAVHKVGSEFLLMRDAWNEIVSFISDYFAHDLEMSVGALKDRFGISRKYAVPILEETDRLGLTSRVGDVRVRGSKL